ncbi:MAG: ATP-binding protein [Anaerolineales bacterium]
MQALPPIERRLRQLNIIFWSTLVVSALIQLAFLRANNPLNLIAVGSLAAIAVIYWLAIDLVNRIIRSHRRQTANLEAMLNGIADGVLVLDLQGNYVAANRALLAMIPEDKLREINSRPLEETLQWKQTVFSIKVMPVPEEGSVLIFHDETRRHETERARDALLAIVSHELRTPLGSIMNYIELLTMMVEAGKIDTVQFSQYLERAHENVTRLTRLVGDIMDQAQIQAGMLRMKNRPCNLRALLQKAYHQMEALAQEKKLFYELSIAPETPVQITCDPHRLQQALVNLLDNAIKFTDRGGVRLRVSRSEEGTLCIEITDTGSGIPKEQLPDIFETFRRGSNYAHRAHQGAGLGLAISQGIITHLGGRIVASSEPGVGSTFTVLLPIQSGES